MCQTHHEQRTGRDDINVMQFACNYLYVHVNKEECVTEKIMLIKFIVSRLLFNAGYSSLLTVKHAVWFVCVSMSER